MCSPFQHEDGIIVLYSKPRYVGVNVRRARGIDKSKVHSRVGLSGQGLLAVRGRCRRSTKDIGVLLDLEDVLKSRHLGGMDPS